MSYKLAYTGAEIDALLGKIDAIFVAEYGSTIYSEVTAAIAAGNKVIVANAGKVYVYAGQDDNGGYVFTQSGPNAAKPNATYVTLSTGNVWSTATVDLATLQQFYASLMEDTASGSIASFPDGAENVPVKELTADIEPIQTGSGDPSPDNIRPILGYTGAEITVAGKNLFDAANVPFDSYPNAGGSMTTGCLLPTVEGKTYTLSMNGTAASYIYLFSKTGDSAAVNMGLADTDTTFIAAADTIYYLRIASNSYSSSFRADLIAAKYQLELGSAATAYEAYNATTYSVSWSDEAGTVYGGHFVVNEDGSVDLTVDHASDTLGTTGWTYSGTPPVFRRTVSTMKASNNALCEAYKTVPYTDSYTTMPDMSIKFGGTGNQVIYVNDSRYTTPEAFVAAVADTQIVYELATPQTYHLDSIGQITTLLGDNNMWSNTGDISVKYRANTALYIEKKLGE